LTEPETVTKKVLLEPHIETPRELYEDLLWVREECFRFYVRQRRAHCAFRELMDLWLRVPYCCDCALSQPFRPEGPADVTPDGWETDMLIQLGLGTLERARRELARVPEFALLCKRCGRELRPWREDVVYVITYHLEEHYGIPLSSATIKQPAEKLRSRVLALYDHKCFGCESVGRPLHMDHVLPRSKGGDTAFRNLQPLCEQCGNLKGDEVPREVHVYSDIYFGPYPSDGFEGLFW
jgi:5-methylcytosine-specific restriction endonuclease McrA